MDKYEMVKSVGKGAFGKVFLYQRKSDSKFVIVKQIHVDETNKSDIQTSLKEAELLKMFNHPNIIQYYESFTVENDYFVIVMEYAQGGTLYQYLEERNGQIVAEDRIINLFSQIVLALHHVHSQNILHRDLKTTNILLDATKEIVKLGDFGISIFSTRTKNMTIIGTPCYLSPEQCQAKPYNKKSDIWALGCILYEMCTLRKAFEADTLPAVIMKIVRGIEKPVNWPYSRKLWMLIEKLLSQDPVKRCSTNALMAEPILINAITDLYTDSGKVPCHNLSTSSSTLVKGLQLQDQQTFKFLPQPTFVNNRNDVNLELSEKYNKK